MGGKLSLILGGLLLATVAGSAFWIDRLQDSIGTLKGNQLILESKIAEQNEANQKSSGQAETNPKPTAIPRERKTGSHARRQ